MGYHVDTSFLIRHPRSEPDRIVPARYPSLVSDHECRWATVVSIAEKIGCVPQTRPRERREERRHDGRVAVDLRNTRWCSNELEIT